MSRLPLAWIWILLWTTASPPQLATSEEDTTMEFNPCATLQTFKPCDLLAIAPIEHHHLVLLTRFAIWDLDREKALRRVDQGQWGLVVSGQALPAIRERWSVIEKTDRLEMDFRRRMYFVVSAQEAGGSYLVEHQLLGHGKSFFRWTPYQEDRPFITPFPLDVSDRLMQLVISTDIPNVALAFNFSSAIKRGYDSRCLYYQFTLVPGENRWEQRSFSEHYCLHSAHRHRILTGFYLRDRALLVFVYAKRVEVYEAVPDLLQDLPGEQTKERPNGIRPKMFFVCGEPLNSGSMPVSVAITVGCITGLMVLGQVAVWYFCHYIWQAEIEEVEVEQQRRRPKMALPSRLTWRPQSIPGSDLNSRYFNTTIATLRSKLASSTAHQRPIRPKTPSNRSTRSDPAASLERYSIQPALPKKQVPSPSSGHASTTAGSFGGSKAVDGKRSSKSLVPRKAIRSSSGGSGRIEMK